MTANLIKLIACITMLSDHIGYCMLEYDVGSSDIASLLRIIGRISMPLFAFLLAEGFKKTHSVFKYIFRILLAAIISEIPFNLMTRGRISAPNSLNVMFTLLLGLLALYTVELLSKSKSKYLKYYSFIPILFICYLAHRFSVDYGFYAVLLILLFYFLDPSSLDSKLWYLPALALFASRYILISYWIGNSANYWANTQLFEILCIIPILLYNGKKGYTPLSKAGRVFQRLGFYLFYPAHMLALYFLFHYWDKIFSLVA